ncbi:hypothetical protein GCM10009854_49890 [Saccharopolyspora halophila]|uniref:Uncharacterized protein n=1 Tax=Saccharopolyspora halophila TaxID=405551 RepID=A0ABN3GZP3_9PSEU
MVCRIPNGRSSRRRSIAVIVLAVVVILLVTLLILAYMLDSGPNTASQVATLLAR